VCMEGLWHDLWTPAIAAAFGTGVGAWLGFGFERRNRAARIEDERVTATNIAMFALVRVWNDLVGIRRRLIDPRRKDPQRWYTLLPTHLPAPVAFDTASLSYLFELDGAVAKNLPMEVHIELSRYEAIYGAATERNQVHSRDAQPAIEKGESTVEGKLEYDTLIVAVLRGHRVLKTLQGLTDQLINLVDASIDTIPETARKLYEIAKAQYPNRTIIQMMPAAIEAALHGPLPPEPNSAAK
jgi:hypothetical protein